MDPRTRQKKSLILALEQVQGGRVAGHVALVNLLFDDPIEDQLPDWRPTNMAVILLMRPFGYPWHGKGIGLFRLAFHESEAARQACLAA